MLRTSALACAFACVLLPAHAAVAAPGFETAPVLKAREILPPELQKGEHYRVAEDVRTDGYLNYYVIDSDFGEFIAEGTPLLRIRVREIEALAQLVELSETDVFIEATKDEGIDFLKGLWRGVSDTERSVKLVPEGTSRLFRKFEHGARLGVKKTEGLIGMGNDEEIRESYYEVSQGEREWAARLGVDPYSSNKTLRKAIRRISTIDFAGEVTFSVASSVAIPIPGLGMVASSINEATDEIWNTDPYELRQANIERLQKAGVTESTIHAFVDHPWYTPTMQTLLIRYLLGMGGVSGTMTVLDAAIEAETEAETRYFVNSILLIAWFHENEVPVKRVLAQSYLPQAVTTDGRQIGFAPLDYLFWGEDFARAAQAAVSQPALGKREVWVLGSVSERARAEIEALGVTVHDQMANYALAKMGRDSRSDKVAR